MAKLNLYTNTTPNNDYIHYYFTSFANFKTAIASNLLTQIDFTNFRINNGIVEVKIDTTLTLSNYKNVTYILNEYDNVCYYVTSAITQSDYIIFYTAIDYWGTYIAQAVLNNLHVTRCNRNIGTGVYDDIEVTNALTYNDFTMSATDKNTSYPNYFNLSRLYIVYTIDFNVTRSLFGSVNSTKLFASNIKDLYDYAVGIDANLASVNALDLAAELVSGIYSVVGSGMLNNLESKVTKAYILPLDLISLLTPASYGITLNAQIPSSPTNDFTIDPLRLDIGTFSRSFTLTIDPDNNYYVGTFLNGLKAKRTTTTATFEYKTYIDYYGVEIVVKQGDNEKEITNLFEIELTLNSGDLTELSAIQHAIKTGLTEASAIATSNPLKAVGGVVDFLSPMFSKVGTGQQRGDGDGLLTWRKFGNAANYCGAKFGFGYSTAASVDSEKAKARLRGANFDEYTTMASVFTASLLGTGTELNTYIQADVNISGIPDTAKDIIKAKFKQGIFINKI